jgi:hypothetical protein
VLVGVFLLSVFTFTLASCIPYIVIILLRLFNNFFLLHYIGKNDDNGNMTPTPVHE